MPADADVLDLSIPQPQSSLQTRRYPSKSYFKLNIQEIVQEARYRGRGTSKKGCKAVGVGAAPFDISDLAFISVRAQS